MQNLKNKSFNILVVDDNQLDVLIVKTLLQHHFNIEIVYNGIDAISIIEKQKFDIILMDINLGGHSENGTQIMKLIRENSKHQDIKIFAVTAYADDPDEYINEGFDGLYIKPVIKEDIFEFINTHMTNK